MEGFRIKRGATLNLTFQFMHADAPLDVGGATLSAQIRAADDTLVAVLPLVKQSTPGLVIGQVLDTGAWPIGRLRGDIKMIVSGQTIFSETFPVTVTREVTRS